MRVQDMRAMTSDEIQTQLDDAYQELFNLRYQLKEGQLENTNRVSEVKRDIARMKTVLRERELYLMWEGESV
jgi:large subunit ribosomal protein L29